MHGKFVNWNFARSVELIDRIAPGHLSLSEGEGEGEGSFTKSSQRSHLNPSPQSSPLGTRGEANRPLNLFVYLAQKCSGWAAEQ